MHNCKLTDAHGAFTFLCSRCGQCYVCKHDAVHFADADKWMWKNSKRKFEEVILDGRLNERKA